MEDDGVRSLEDPRRYGDALQRILGELGIAYTTLGESVKDLYERVAVVEGELARMNESRKSEKRGDICIAV